MTLLIKHAQQRTVRVGACVWRQRHREDGLEGRIRMSPHCIRTVTSRELDESTRVNRKSAALHAASRSENPVGLGADFQFLLRVPAMGFPTPDRWSVHQMSTRHIVHVSTCRSCTRQRTRRLLAFLNIPPRACFVPCRWRCAGRPVGGPRRRHMRPFATAARAVTHATAQPELQLREGEQTVNSETVSSA